MTTIARQASLRIADRTAPLAQLVINAKFAAIVESLLADIEAEAEGHEHVCQMCDQGADYLYIRLADDGDEIEACETCVDTYRLAYAAD